MLKDVLSGSLYSVIFIYDGGLSLLSVTSIDVWVQEPVGDKSYFLDNA